MRVAKGEKPKSVRVTCGKCRSRVEWEEQEVRFDQYDGHYIDCPVCGNVISVTPENWRPY